MLGWRRSGSRLALAAMPRLPAEGAAEVGEDVAEEIGADDDLERLRPQHEARRHRVDQPLLGLDVRVVARRRGAKTSSQRTMPYCWALLLVTLVTFRRLPRPGQLEGVADDPLAPLLGEERGLDGDLAPGAARRRSCARRCRRTRPRVFSRTTTQSTVSGVALRERTRRPPAAAAPGARRRTGRTPGRSPAAAPRG